jgi:hypothetical protein
MKKLNIIYIAGVGRSGSTILDQILGQIPGICSLGEVRQLWQSIQNNSPCGCGTPITKCDFWAPVLDGLVKGGDSLDQIQQRIKTIELCKTYPRLHRLARLGNYAEEYEKHSCFLQKLYATLRENACCDYLVDSSKDPYYAAMLSRIPNVLLHVIHLVRHPSGYVYSLKKTKLDLAQKKLMAKRSTFKAAGRWLWVNFRAESLRSKATSFDRIKYEDLIEAPRKLLHDILQTVANGENFNLDFLNAKLLNLNPTHSAAGNPCRFQKHEIHLNLDDEWKTNLYLKDRLFTTLVTFSMATRYSYFM